MKPFTFVAAIMLLVVAICHAYRAYAGLALVIGTFSVPILWSWVAAAGCAILALMLFVERGK